jgi:hypothetical protein
MSKKSIYAIVILATLLLVLAGYIMFNSSDSSKSENFALSGVIITDPKLLNPTKVYYVGTRSISNIKTPATNGGVTPCGEFPDVVYREAPSADATCVITEANPVPPDDSYYNFSTAPTLATDIYPRYFNPILFSITTSTGAVSKAMSVSFNSSGIIFLCLVGGTTYWSSSFGSSNQTFNLVPSGITFNSASIGNGNAMIGSRDTNKVVYYGDISTGYTPVANGATYYNLVNPVVGTALGGNKDYLLLGLGDSNTTVYLQYAASFYFKPIGVFTPITSLSIDQSVTSICSYIPATSTVAATSNLYVISLSASDAASSANTLLAPMAANVNTVSTANWKKIKGNPIITNLFVSEDLKGFGVTATGQIVICKNVLSTLQASDWVVLPSIDGVVFSKVFYRKTTADFACAVDVNGLVYVQRNITAMFTRAFPV